jgi:hypothetical protein
MCESSTPQPNHFELKGGNIKITYDSTSIAGKPVLKYEKVGGVQNFMGDEIRRLDTEIGQQITVTTDRHGTTLTLLVTIFNLKGYETSLTTWAITTTLRRSDSGEPELPGEALQTYRVDELKGTARKVYFVK